MPVPSSRNKILPVRGNIATLQSNVGSLAEGEICYALDEDQYYQIESGALVAVGATKAQGLLADTAVQPTDSIDVLADVDTTTAAPTTGQFLEWDGTNWVPGSASGGTVNLGYTTAASTGTVTNDSGTDATIPAATTSLAGLLTGADKTKLDGIAAGAQVNVATDLTYTASTRVLASSTGTDATLPEVVAAGDSGLMTGSDKTKLDGIAAGAEVNVNADWNAVSGDAQILNKPTLGTAAAADTTDFATAAQGTLADSALQPGDTIDFAPGTAAAPGLFPTGDTDTGIYSPGADTVGVSTAGSERLRIDSSGNVSIHQNQAVNRPQIILSAPDDGTNYRHLFGANLRVDSSGTYTTPATGISAGGWLYEAANNLAAHGNMIYLSATDTNAESSTPVERLRIDAAGRLLAGTSNRFRGDDATLVQLQSAANTGIAFNRSDATILDGNSLGQIHFYADDETNTADRCAIIEAIADGAQANDDRPTSLVFGTTPSAASSPTERMRIKSTGAIRCVTAFTVATLPTGEVGDLARVTDASSPSIGSTVAGGGAANALCWYNGSNWTVMGI